MPALNNNSSTSAIDRDDYTATPQRKIAYVLLRRQQPHLDTSEWLLRPSPLISMKSVVRSAAAFSRTASRCAASRFSVSAWAAASASSLCADSNDAVVQGLRLLVHC